MSTAAIDQAGVLPPFFIITPDDHAGYIAVASYTFLVLMLCLVTTRVFTRWYIVRYLKVDDAILSIAAVLGIAQSVVLQMALKHGLGRKERLIPPSDFTLYQKYEYAAQILLILTIAAAKVSLSSLLQSMMSSDKRTMLWSRVVLGIVVAWAIASAMALGFQCSLPNPWDSNGNCVDQAVLHYAIGVFNILTDTALIVLPCVVFWSVHDPVRRIRVVSLFSVRIIAIIVTAIQLSCVGESYRVGADRTWDSIHSSIWDQVMMNISIFSTALPSLGRLLVDFQPDVNTFAITNQQRARNNKPGERYAFTNTFGHRFSPEYVKSNGLGAQTSVLGSRSHEEDNESVQGLREDGLRQNVIQQTIGFEVKYTTE